MKRPCSSLDTTKSIKDLNESELKEVLRAAAELAILLDELWAKNGNGEPLT